MQNSLFCATFDTGEAQTKEKNLFFFFFDPRTFFFLRNEKKKKLFRPGTQKHNRPQLCEDQATPKDSIGAPTNIYPDILWMRVPLFL